MKDESMTKMMSEKNALIMSGLEVVRLFTKNIFEFGQLSSINN
jgi:hypothetical protein